MKQLTRMNKDRNLYNYLSRQPPTEIYNLELLRYIYFMCLSMYIYTERYTNVDMHT